MTTTTTTKTLWVGAEPDPDDRLQIDVSEEDYNRVPERGTGGSRGPVTVTDLRTGKQLMVRRASCGIPHCLCALELVRWLDPLPQSQSFPRFSFAVVTGRYKILDNRSSRLTTNQIATADGEEEARLIVTALNQYDSSIKG